MTINHSTRIVLLLFFYGTILNLHAQRTPMRFGRIDEQDIMMTEYAADSSANALVLGDIGTIEVVYNNNSGWEYQFTRHLRMKIFNKDAFNAADFKIYLHNADQGEKERLMGLKAKIFTPEDGKIKKGSFKRSDAFVEEISPYLNSVNFTLPGINEGSVFDLTYTIRSPFLYTLPVWIFQKEYPTVFSELQVFVPEYFAYKPLMQGFLNLDNRTSSTRNKNIEIVWHVDLSQNREGSSRRSESLTYLETIYTYRIDNAPALTEEPHSNALINYLSKIEHELSFYRSPSGKATDYSSTWPKLNKRLMDSESFGRMLNKSGFLRDEIEAIKGEFNTPEERLIAAYKLIQSSMTWNQVNSIWAGRSLRKAWNDKSGNAADINLMLINLLRELDIEAHPVIISTRNHGMINQAQIMLDKFNYVIAQASIDGKIFLMDATDKHTPFFLLPERCLNGEGRLVKETGDKWVKLEAPVENLNLTHYSIKVKPCGSMEMIRRQEQTSYVRLEKEDVLRSYDKDEEYMDFFESSNQGIELMDFSVENKDDWSVPLITHYTYQMNSPTNQPKDVIYLNPMLTERLEANPFRLENRLYPVDFIYPIRKSYIINIELPDGYIVEELPRNHSFSMAQNAAWYSVKYTLHENGNIEVKVDQIIGKALFLHTEYASLRSFYAQMVEEQARNIILKKI